MKLALLLTGSLLPLFLASCPGQPPPPTNPGYDCSNPPAFASGQIVPTANAIAGQYIVRRKAGAAVQPLMEPQGVAVTQRYPNGYAARIAQTALLQLLADPNVVVFADGTKSVDPRNPRIAAATASWGLDRIDQRSGTDGHYDPGADGAGIHVGIVDTGVSAHPDFGDRLSPIGFTAHGSSWADGHGHGTHVAGTVGGTKWGVAKAVTIHPAKVLSDSGSGSDSQVIAGITWFTRTCKENGWTCIGNMSLGGSAAPALDQSVCDSIAEGVQWAIAAGNENRDANTSSPARVRQAITTGATQSFGDRRADFSNFGVLLDLFAPGVDIESTQPGGGTAIFSGTSMASPHVAGAAALYRQRHPGATPSEVEAGLVATATPDVVFDAGPGCECQ